MRRTAPLDRPTRRTYCATTVLAIIAAAAGCSTHTSPPAPQGATVFVAPPASTPPTPSADAGSGLQQPLTNAVTRYTQVYSSLYVNPRQDLSVIDTVATGQGADSLRSQATQVADQHLIVTGEIKVLRVTVVSVDPNPPIAASPATVTVKSCNDVSSTTVTTSGGKSNVDPKRGPQTQTVLMLTNANPANAAAWRVSTVEPSTTLCDPS